MNSPILEEFQIKEQRIHDYLEKNDLEGVVIGTQGNFSWISGGGRSNVLITSEGADALVLVTRKARTVIAYNMDVDRNRDEEMGGLGFDSIKTHWNEKSREEIVLDLLGGKKFLSDIPLEGGLVDGKAFYDLIYPLTDQEIERYRVIASAAEDTLLDVINTLRPGIRENEIEARLIAEFARKEFVSTVVLVGSRERLMKYRHPIPSTRIADGVVLLVLCPRKYGLHIPITRTICLNGEIDRETERKFEAASTIAAHCIAHSVPGNRFADILSMQKKLYKELGFENEWMNHFQGGITGYIPNDSTLCWNPEMTVKDRQTFNWFITITGVNTEDTYLSGVDEILTRSGKWPLKNYSVNGKEISLPMILRVC